MGWNRVRKVAEAGTVKHWLQTLEPSMQAEEERQLKSSIEKVEKALAGDKELSYAFRLTLNIVRQRGRVDGLREGLKLYQYGVRILERNTPLFWSIIKYAARFSDRKKPSTPQICEYLDRELRRIGQLKTGGHNKPIKRSVIAPPESWRCDTWAEALEIKRNDVDVLFSAARTEAHSEQFATLMAWSLWGHPRTAKRKRKP